MFAPSCLTPQGHDHTRKIFPFSSCFLYCWDILFSFTPQPEKTPSYTNSPSCNNHDCRNNYVATGVFRRLVDPFGVPQSFKRFHPFWMRVPKSGVDPPKGSTLHDSAKILKLKFRPQLMKIDNTENIDKTLMQIESHENWSAVTRRNGKKGWSCSQSGIHGVEFISTSLMSLLGTLHWRVR